MALLKKIKEKLGFGTGSNDHDTGETTVTVEKDGAETEAVDDESTDTERTAETSPETVEEPVEEDEESTETEEQDVEEGADDGTIEDDGTVAEPDDGTVAEPDDETVAEPDDETGEPVEEIKGIGPAYGERLAEIGIRSVADLAAADPADVAEGVKVSEKRASTWIDRAGEF